MLCVTGKARPRGSSNWFSSFQTFPAARCKKKKNQKGVCLSHLISTAPAGIISTTPILPGDFLEGSASWPSSPLPSAPTLLLSRSWRSSWPLSPSRCSSHTVPQQDFSVPGLADVCAASHQQPNYVDFNTGTLE